LDSCRDYQRDAYNHRAYDYGESYVLVFFYLFSHGERRSFYDDKKGYAENDQANQNENQGCDQNFHELVKLDNQTERVTLQQNITDRFNQHLLSSTKACVPKMKPPIVAALVWRQLITRRRENFPTQKRCG
jgi:hypothetical protein